MSDGVNNSDDSAVSPDVDTAGSADASRETDSGSGIDNSFDSDAGADGAAPSPAAPVRWPIGPYEYLRTTGAGGQGEVHVVRDSRTGEIFALKVLRERWADAAPRVARLRELRHANIARIVDAGPTDELGRRTFVVSELQVGFTLEKRLLRRDLDLDARLAAVELVARGAGHAHARGIVHRDLKPQNVMVNALGPLRQVKLIDFDLAHATGQEHRTLTAKLKGTLGWVSPEVAVSGSKHATARSDVFALGILLHRSVTGRHLLSGDPYDQLVALRRGDLPFEVPLLGKFALRDMALRLEAVVRRATALRPEDRYANGAELAADIALVRAGRVPSAPILGSVPRLVLRVVHGVRSHAFVILVALVSALALVLVVGALSRRMLVAHLDELLGDRAILREELDRTRDGLNEAHGQCERVASEMAALRSRSTCARNEAVRRAEVQTRERALFAARTEELERAAAKLEARLPRPDEVVLPAADMENLRAGTKRVADLERERQSAARETAAERVRSETRVRELEVSVSSLETRLFRAMREKQAAESKCRETEARLEKLVETHSKLTTELPRTRSRASAPTRSESKPSATSNWSSTTR